VQNKKKKPAAKYETLKNRAEYLTILKKLITAEVKTYFMFKFYFLSAHKLT